MFTHRHQISRGQPCQAGAQSIAWPKRAGGASWRRAAGRVLMVAGLLLAGLGVHRVGAQGVGPALQDQFADREVATGVEGQIDGVNFAATREPGEPQHGGKPGARSLWLSWIAPTNGVVRFETEGSGFDTLLSAYWAPGTNQPGFADLLELARADDSEGLEHESEVKFGVLAGERYEIAVDGYYGAAGRIEVGWVFEPTDRPPPIVMSVPPDRSVGLGQPVVLSVTLSNAANGRYRWYRNGEEVGGQSPVLNLASVGPGDVGRYRLKVSIDGPDYYSVPVELQINTDGAATSLAQDKILDSLGTGLGPGGDGFAPLLFRLAGGAGSVTRGYNGTQIFNTTYAISDPAEPRHCDLTGGSSYWYAYTPPADGTLILDTVGSAYDTFVAVYTYDAPLSGYGDLVAIACDNDSGGTTNGASRLEFAAPKARQFLVVIDGINGARGIGQLNYRLDTNRPPVPPTLLEAPLLVRAAVGGMAVLRPVVTGSGPLRFSWETALGPIPGATNADLTLEPVMLAHAGEYRVRVSSHVGGPLDVVVPLRVLTPPALSWSPGAGWRFPTLFGQRYYLEHATDLNEAWQVVGGPWEGDGLDLTVTNAPVGPVDFYRVRVE